PDRAVGRGCDVVRVRACGHAVLLHTQPGRGARGRTPQRRPLAGQDAPDDTEPAVPERPEDDRLALLERLPGRLLDDDVVGDEDGERPLSRPGAYQPARVADLPAPGGVVLGGDGVQER